MGEWEIIRGDVLETLEGELLDEIGLFDAMFSDPPYGLTSGKNSKTGFMGKAWDHGVPSAEVYRAAMRHLRPGAKVLQFGGPRTVHRLTCSIEDAGFEIRDRIYCWIFGSGWPKPANVSKFIDKRLGKERALVPRVRPDGHKLGLSYQGSDMMNSKGDDVQSSPIAISPEAARFDGYHANLAPACEPAILARKPLDGTLANNALTHGLAGLNVDGCRISTTDALSRANPVHDGSRHRTVSRGSMASIQSVGNPQGRWPSNVILTCDEAICGPGDPRAIDHQPGCHVFEMDRQSGVESCRPARYALSGEGIEHAPGSTVYGDGKTLGARTGYTDTGGASRFFYCAKVSKSERGVSAHPCMKPIALCTYLARLLLPPPRADGQPRRILIPYSGSGSEMIGALAAGWDVVVGIEWDASAQNPGKRPDYWADVAEHRIREWKGSLRGEDVKSDVVDGKAQQLGLF